ncbi:hypothetical protein Niako_0522 [Niastella koreensis GR20-10]|uniref:Uncharacterized protein n=1 Tax=Niastella koreensis (strain DSM 17620 / KACC 11465 / NBRC 106392 / GR20-10) TaxID=700598 RepID=G8T7X9_NIAKG|nr:hypothetical protein Niako_0522 [Niastella koreensis GR20-10]
MFDSHGAYVEVSISQSTININGVKLEIFFKFPALLSFFSQCLPLPPRPVILKYKNCPSYIY